MNSNVVNWRRHAKIWSQLNDSQLDFCLVFIWFWLTLILEKKFMEMIKLADCLSERTSEQASERKISRKVLISFQKNLPDAELQLCHIYENWRNRRNAYEYILMNLVGLCWFMLLSVKDDNFLISFCSYFLNVVCTVYFEINAQLITALTTVKYFWFVNKSMVVAYWSIAVSIREEWCSGETVRLSVCLTNAVCAQLCSRVIWVCCWFSPCSAVFLRVLHFPSSAGYV